MMSQQVWGLATNKSLKEIDARRLATTRPPEHHGISLPAVVPAEYREYQATPENQNTMVLWYRQNAAIDQGCRKRKCS